MFENPRRGRQERNFTTNNPKILDLKSSSEQIFSRKLSLGAPEIGAIDKSAYLAVVYLKAPKLWTPEQITVKKEKRLTFLETFKASRKW